nr:hypothetical protein [Kofleriaceae bacterium]
MPANDHDDPDDMLDGPIPDVDAEPTAAERAHARAFADLVDKTLAGRTPPAMSADDRALLEVATVIRAASGQVELATSKQRSLVEGALAQAIGGRSPAASLGGAIPIAVAARRRWLPWTVAGASTAVAAAAVIALWLGVGARREPPAAAQHRAVATVRSPDELIGPIAREQAGDASDRVDELFADRLDGYRAELYGGAP